MRSAQKQLFGFTLIELLIVITVIGILAAATIPSFNSFTQTQRLNQAAKQVKQDLRSAQNRALSSIDGRAWGIFFDHAGTTYTPFKCPPDQAPDFRHNLLNSNCEDLSPISLPSNVAIDPTSTVYDAGFDAVNGDVYYDNNPLSGPTPVNIVLELNGITRTVSIYAGGKIED